MCPVRHDVAPRPLARPSPQLGRPGPGHQKETADGHRGLSVGDAPLPDRKQALRVVPSTQHCVTRVSELAAGERVDESTPVRDLPPDTRVCAEAGWTVGFHGIEPAP